MSTQFKETYSAIQSTINQNLESIKELLEQTQALYSLAESLEGAEEELIRESIFGEVEKMRKTIDDLIEQTEVLFKAYKRAYELAFQNA